MKVGDPVELKGTRLIAASPDRLYRALTSPQVLVEAMPGLKKLEAIGPLQYEAEMEMGVASIRGRYQGQLQIQNPTPPQSYQLTMTGQGSGGFINVSMEVELTAQGSATAVHYTGDAKVGGKVAGVGQRLLGGVASLILSQFFGAIETHVRSPE
jgi:hypothetical protein